MPTNHHQQLLRVQESSDITKYVVYRVYKRRIRNEMIDCGLSRKRKLLVSILSETDKYLPIVLF